MVSGLVIGLSLGRNDAWFWGIVIGLILAQSARLHSRVKALERTIQLLRQPTQRAPEVVVSTAVDPGQEPEVELAFQAAPGSEPRPEPGPGTAVANPFDEPNILPEESLSSSSVEIQSAAPVAQTEHITSTSPPKVKSAAPAEPSLVQRGFSFILRFFTEGNPLVRIGALVMFVGVAFLLRYLAERVTVAIEVRLLGIAAGGLAMIAAGWLLRISKPGFALPFQGAGIGVLYLTTYASLRLYHLIPGPLAFGLMLLVVALTIALALGQDAMILAALGVAGGFLAPVLASTGQGSHVELFSFYLTLNLVIAVVSWFRAWRILNWLGWVFTFGIASVWGAQYYQPHHLESTEPFLIAHFVLYLAVAILFASRQPPKLKGFVDGTLVFGTPIVAFTLQSLLLRNSEYGLAWSAATLGVVYLLLRWILLRRDSEHFQLLGQSFLALGAGFLTLAIPLAFDARVTSAMWTLEGAAVAWIGIRQSSFLRRLSGYALMVVGSLAYLIENTPSSEQLLFLNADFLGILIIAGVFMFIGHLLRRDLPDSRFPLLATLFWLWGVLWWYVGGIDQIESHLQGSAELLAAVSFAGLSAIVCTEYARGCRWRAAQATGVLMAITLLLIQAGMGSNSGQKMFLNANMVSVILSCAAMVLVGFRQLNSDYPAPFRFWGNGLAVLATGLWLWSGMMELDIHLPKTATTAWSLIWTSASLLGIFSLARLLSWPELRWVNHALPGFLLLFLIAFADLNMAVFQGLGLLVWPLAFAIQYYLLWRSESEKSRILTAVHAGCFWILNATLVYGVDHWLNIRLGNGSAIGLAGLSLAPVIVLALARSNALATQWPVGNYLNAYQGRWLWPIMIWLTAWLLLANTSSPPAFVALPYWPVANFVDLTSIVTVISLGIWWQRRQFSLDITVMRLGAGCIGALGFLWLNAALLRALHFQLPIAWNYQTLWHSFTVQASVTILWSFSAVALMLIGARIVRRWVWVIGAGLMGMAVLKLFVIDTAAGGTLARIAAFFGVAIGLFLAGYFVPRPPAGADAQD